MKVPKHSSAFIRRAFIEYFVKNDHNVVRSSPIVPFYDPSLSFVNAGMNQFKNVLLGIQSAPHARVVNSQKCIRVGGKHNDLSAVGNDGYHHTFFEMLGNWSFGDYFKEKACKLTWTFLTSPPISIPANQLFVTYFSGDERLGLRPDLEVKNIWLSLGVHPMRIVPCDMKDNFWEMGKTGPCGPCTEIHYDYCASDDSSVANRATLVNKGTKEVIELWNLVFVEYNRLSNGSLNRLPLCHVDTGMGFERFVAILQGKSSNYDTDLFTGLFDAVTKLTGAPAYTGTFEAANKSCQLDTAYRIVADHTRMCTVALADNMFPDQNHKLRRVLRKALTIAESDFKVKKGFELINEVANKVSEVLTPVYPEIGNSIKKIHYMIENENELMKELKDTSVKEWKKIVGDNQVLGNAFTGFEAVGLPLAYQELVAAVRDNKDKDNGTINADIALKLYDTYGLDSELIHQLITASGFNFCQEDFDNKLALLKEERVKKTALSAMRVDIDIDQHINTLRSLVVPVTDDKHKYTMHRKVDDTGVMVDYVFPDVTAGIQCVINLDDVSSRIVEGVCMCAEGSDVVLKNGQKVAVICDKSNFYSEAGGQWGDTGQMTFVGDATEGRVLGSINVEKVVKYHGYVLHIGKVKLPNSAAKREEAATSCTELNKEKCISFKIGSPDVSAVLTLDANRRLSSMRNHTATHLINSVLHNELVVTCQKSSTVNSDHLVFDFGLYRNELSVKDYIKLENSINDMIKAKLPVCRQVMTPDVFMKLDGVTMLPGETYTSQNISVIEIQDASGKQFISREPCCGTHVTNTSDIDEFRLINVKSKSKNVKSLKAVTGVNAKVTARNDKLILEKIDNYRDNLKDFTNKLSSEMDEKLLNDFDVELQTLKNELITSVEKKYFSYGLLCNAVDTIDAFSGDVKKMARVVLKSKLQSEMQAVVNNLNLSDQESGRKYLIHFVESSSTIDSPSLHKVTKMCPTHIPIMLFSYSQTDNLLKGRCSIPAGMNSNLTADLWMTTVSRAIDTSESVIKGQDPKLVCGMKPKKIAKEELKKTIELLLAEAEQTVKSALKKQK